MVKNDRKNVLRRARYAKKKAEDKRVAEESSRAKQFESTWAQRQKRNERMQRSRTRSSKKKKTSKSK